MFRLVIKDCNEEVWRDYPKCHLYQVSSYGQVRSKKIEGNGIGVGHNRKGKVLSQNMTANYPRCHLSFNGKDWYEFVHIMVVETFPEICGVKNDAKDIHHLDCCRTNNQAVNLTAISKNAHREMHNSSLKKTLIGKQNIKGFERRSGKDNYMARPVIGTDKDGVEYRFDTIREAAKCFGRKPSTISCALSGKSHTACGCKWRYA